MDDSPIHEHDNSAFGAFDHGAKMRHLQHAPFFLIKSKHLLTNAKLVPGDHVTVKRVFLDSVQHVSKVTAYQVENSLLAPALRDSGRFLVNHLGKRRRRNDTRVARCASSLFVGVNGIGFPND